MINKDLDSGARNRVDLLRLRSSALFGVGKKMEALMDIQVVFDIDSDRTVFDHFHYGFLMLDLHRPVEAISYFQKVLDYDDEFYKKTATFLLAVSFAMRGNAEQARCLIVDFSDGDAFFICGKLWTAAEIKLLTE